MPIITLSRELGSQGDDVAVAVARRLGLRLVGRGLINRAAQAAGAPEIALAEIDELGLLGMKPSRAAMQLYAEKVAEVIRELAAQGDVLLVGRGGQAVLAGRPDVLRVRVIAPRPMRVRLVQERCRISAEAASARVEATDRARAGYLWRTHRIRPDAPEHYDLVINMAHLSVIAAVELICAAAARPAEAHIEQAHDG